MLLKKKLNQHLKLKLMIKLYVSFGQVHTHSVNGKTFDKDSIAVIEAEDYEGGRDIAFQLFGPKFATTYSNKPNMEFFPRGLINVKN